MQLEKLKRNVQNVQDDLNDNDFGVEWDACVDSHANGPSIDISKDGGAPKKVTSHFFEAAHEAGYKVTGMNITEGSNMFDDKTRLFLRERDDPSDYADGFKAGVRVALDLPESHVEEWREFFDDA